MQKFSLEYHRNQGPLHGDVGRATAPLGASVKPLPWPAPAPSWTRPDCGWTLTYTGLTDAESVRYRTHQCGGAA